MQGHVVCRTTTLGERHVHACTGGLERHAQRRGRRMARRAQRPQQEKKRRATLRGQMQPAQHVGGHAG